MNITINCEYANLETAYDKNMMKISLVNCNKDFIGDIEIEDIITKVDNSELFEKLIENDEDLLHSYLETHGYLKAHGYI